MTRIYTCIRQMVHEHGGKVESWMVCITPKTFRLEGPSSEDSISNRGQVNVGLDGGGTVGPKVEAVEKRHALVVETGDLVGLAGSAATGAGDLDLSAAVKYEVSKSWTNGTWT